MKRQEEILCMFLLIITTFVTVIAKPADDKEATISTTTTTTTMMMNMMMNRMNSFFFRTTTTKEDDDDEEERELMKVNKTRTGLIHRSNNNNSITTKSGIITVPALTHETFLRRHLRRRHLLLNNNNNNTSDVNTTTKYLSSIYQNRPKQRRRRQQQQSSQSSQQQESLQVGGVFQGYGTHYLDLWIGSPPQRQTVVIDTGSVVTAFPCSDCHDCGHDYHVDPYFRPDFSSTSSSLTCGRCYNGNCQNNPEQQQQQQQQQEQQQQPSNNNDHNKKDKKEEEEDKCIIGMSYLEGSSWSAYEVRDVAYAGGLHDQAVPIPSKQSNKHSTTSTSTSNSNLGYDPTDASSFAFNFTFGCQTRVTDLFRTQLADGIAGMENVGGSLWAQMYTSGAIHQRMFSLCFSRRDWASKSGTRAGAVTFGGINPIFHETPMIYARNMQLKGFYSVRLQSVYLREHGGQRAAAAAVLDDDDDPSSIQKLHRLDLSEDQLNDGGVIVDSGTTDTYLVHHLAQPFLQAYQQITGKTYHHDPIALTHQEIQSLPTILFVVVGSPENAQWIHSTDNIRRPTVANPINAGLPDNEDEFSVVIAVPPSHYMEYDVEIKKYRARVYLEENRGSVLGANVLQGHDVLFDSENGLIGWAESQCDYDAFVDGTQPGTGYERERLHKKKTTTTTTTTTTTSGRLSNGQSLSNHYNDDGGSNNRCTSGECKFSRFLVALLVLLWILLRFYLWFERRYGNDGRGGGGGRSGGIIPGNNGSKMLKSCCSESTHVVGSSLDKKHQQHHLHHHSIMMKKDDEECIALRQSMEA